nr:hypothetical protein [Tanacetum cinerariifolium]
DFVPESIYPKYIPLEDEHILPAEEQPLPSVVSTTAESPGYVAESDPEKDLEESLTDSAVVIPNDELVSLPEETEPVMPPPSTNTVTTEARITV